MSSEDVFTHIVDEITRLLPEVEGDVNADSRLEADLGMDSIHVIDLITNIERSLGISITDTEAESFKQVSDIADAVAEHKSAV